MIIVTIRTDKPESEIGLYDTDTQLAYEVWAAHRQLAETLHAKLKELLANNNKSLSDIGGIVCFKGPGSFTGLRIGISVANALAYSGMVPILGVEGESDWIERGLKGLKEGKNDTFVVPAYGAPVHITQPKN